MKSYLKLVAVLGAVFLQACASTNEQQQVSAVGQLLIAEPLQIDYKSEVAIARLSELIMRSDITDAQRAQFYYDRGVRYDSVGLRSLARLDFNLALRLKPDFVDAFNFIGIHFTQLQEFNQAYEYFDSTLELAPEHEYAYLNRGVALYYGGRPELAVDDLAVFFQRDTSDPYRALWLYLAEHSVDSTTANLNLNKRVDLVDDKFWAKSIIHFYRGAITQEQFLKGITVGVRSNKELTERLCEGYFYLAKYRQFKGDINGAANFFKLAMGTNVYEFVEHRYAKLELDLMRIDAQQASAIQQQNEQ